MLHAVRHKEIVTGATRRAAGVHKDPPVIKRKEARGMILVDRNNIGIPPRTTTQVWTVTGPSAPLISIGSHNIEGPRRSIIPKEVRNAETIKSSININTDKHRNNKPSWSKVIGSKKFTNKSADIYARGWTNFGSDTVLSKSTNFMDFGLLSVKTTYELGFVFIPTTRSRRPTDGSNWILTGQDISEAKADRVSGTKANNHYNFKSEFETRREKMLDQYFGRQNNLMSRPTLESTPLGANTTNGTTSLID